MRRKIMSKQVYKIFKSRDTESISQWFSECGERRIVNLWGVEKNIYTSIEWDYYSLKEYLQFKDLKNCSYREEIEKLHTEYIKNNPLPKNKSLASIQDGVGRFFVKNEDAVVVLDTMNRIFQEMIDSNCMNATPIEDITFPEELLEVLGVKK